MVIGEKDVLISNGLLCVGSKYGSSCEGGGRGWLTILAE
jgi:hypothetical protein